MESRILKVAHKAIKKIEKIANESTDKIIELNVGYDFTTDEMMAWKCLLKTHNAVKLFLEEKAFLDKKYGRN